jgi:signal transduction histidine kinase
MVEEFLDFNRIRYQSLIEDLQKINLNDLVGRVASTYLSIAESMNLAFKFIPIRGIPEIWGDPGLLERAITNLVVNALNYTPAGEVTICIFEIPGSICVEIQDTGIGIEAEDLPHLFERFYRGRQIRQTNQIGSGLGLAIVKEILDQHHATIDIESTVGKGSRFRVCFPVE